MPSLWASASWRDPVSRLSTPLSSDRAVLIAMSCHTRLGCKAAEEHFPCLLSVESNPERRCGAGIRYPPLQHLYKSARGIAARGRGGRLYRFMNPPDAQ